jgi:quercetin dioxygenase-like cupin family protein
VPLTRTTEHARFSDAGPVPRPLSMGERMVAMLLCLQHGQQLVAPEGDGAETIFTVLEGTGHVREGDERHAVRAGDVVHVLPGTRKALEAGDGTLLVLGVRAMGGFHAP